MTTTLRGVFAPTLTPLKDDLSIDTDRYITHCKRLLADGCHGLAPFGTTSEANSFSIVERMDLLERLVDSGVAPEILMPGTGMCAIPDTVRLTKHAVELGCGGVLMLPPFYYKDVPDEGIFRAMAQVIDRVGDERLRVYLYHIPQVAQVGFSLDLIERLITAYPTTVVGIKDSSGDWKNLHAMLTRFPDFGIFTGTERFLMKTLQHGGIGGINAVANVIAGKLRTLHDNFDAPDAPQQQEAVLAITNARGAYAPVPVLKQIVAREQNDAAWLNIRPPLLPLTEAEVATFFAALN